MGFRAIAFDGAFVRWLCMISAVVRVGQLARLVRWAGRHVGAIRTPWRVSQFAVVVVQGALARLSTS
jgi:hypothetical protein